MKQPVRVGLTALLVAFASWASAAPRYTNDLLYDYAWRWVDKSQGLWQGHPQFEIVKLGSECKSGKLYFSLLQDLPHDGSPATDSYGGGQSLTMNPGDLAIVVGSKDPFAIPSATVKRHGIALTSHANVVPQKYNTGGVPDVWKPVVEGKLYIDATFATGTLENYQEWLKTLDPTDVYPAHTPPYWPEDPDNGDPLTGTPDDQINSYMTLIMDYGAEVDNVSTVTWQQIQRYDPFYDQYYTSYLITGWVDMAAIGLDDQTDYSLFHAPECGNDGVKHSSAIPEPATGTLVLLGLLAARRRRK